ncbi:hypothetical protein EIN_283850 [Entamoeba invadens IP1]|uniref:WW domain-containing protein n=1 Tax=Entamoeba invadens IP1 TaxID=370355 RepID=L7FKM1_ENTIV|nr:hypothetical protein EIN_283850 [Entamoeba invadens IP1]ELP84839.1 hypothetical protein EIN_283850 [Entamoeba invadens IP1]|eukprot:XP_004184185.1 hypothetical protein EIN_283850 [Entamoeba invadens IP1]
MQQDYFPTTINLFSFGTFGQPVNGYVEIAVPFPSFIRNIQLTVVSCFTGIKVNTTTPPQVPPMNIDSNIEQWSKLTSYLTPIVQFDCLPKNDIQELPTGNHRFPFTFVIPMTNCPMLVIPQEDRIKFVYEIKATVFLKQLQFDSAYYPLPMLFHPIAQLQSPPSQVSTPFNKDSNLKVFIPKTTYFTGERVDITLTLELKKPIYRAALSLVGMYRAPGCVHRITFNSTLIPMTPEPKRFVIDILPIVPPTIITQFFRFEHFVLVELYLQLGPPLKVFIPITVVTSQDPSIKQMYATVSGVVLPKSPFLGINRRPPPPFPSSIVNGMQQGITEEGEIVNLDHKKKTMERNGDTEEVYPFFMNTMLPENWIIGYNRNERYFIDVEHKVTSWKDPREESAKVPQHVQRHSKGVLNVMAVRYEGISNSSKKEPEVFGMVFTDVERVLKTDVVKGCDGDFGGKTLGVELDNERENVCFFVFVKGKPDVCVGCVNFELSLMPFPSIIEGWFYLRPLAFTDNVSTGRVKLRVAYVEQAMALNEVIAMNIRSVTTSCNVPFYPYTEMYIEEARRQQERMEKGGIRMIKEEEGRIVLTWGKGELVGEKEKFFSKKSKKHDEEVPLIDLKGKNEEDLKYTEEKNDKEKAFDNMVAITETLMAPVQTTQVPPPTTYQNGHPFDSMNIGNPTTTLNVGQKTLPPLPPKKNDIDDLRVNEEVDTTQVGDDPVDQPLLNLEEPKNDPLGLFK